MQLAANALSDDSYLVLSMSAYERALIFEREIAKNFSGPINLIVVQRRKATSARKRAVDAVGAFAYFSKNSL